MLSSNMLCTRAIYLYIPLEVTGQWACIWPPWLSPFRSCVLSCLCAATSLMLPLLRTREAILQTAFCGSMKVGANTCLPTWLSPWPGGLICFGFPNILPPWPPRRIAEWPPEEREWEGLRKGQGPIVTYFLTCFSAPHLPGTTVSEKNLCTQCGELKLYPAPLDSGSQFCELCPIASCTSTDLAIYYQPEKREMVFSWPHFETKWRNS
jgi:hypothetical protein